MSFVARFFVLVTVATLASCSTSEPKWSQGAVAECVNRCVTPADCVFGGDASHDANNFECVSGVCHYLGCVSDTECSSVGGDGVCAPTPYLGYPTCTKRCSTSNDCSFGSLAYDADNFECVSGACLYIGCHDDNECNNGVPGASACLEFATGIPRQCVGYCETEADCVLPDAKPAWNADNYRCVQNRCQYLGCDSDIECQASIGNSICKQP